MRRLTTVLVAGGLLLGATGASAQSDVANGNASITIPTLLSISVDVLAVQFNAPTFTDYDAGWIPSSVTSTIDTRSNVVHDVTIGADAATMTYTGALGGSKPAGDLQWSADAGSTWAGLLTGGADVATALPRGNQPGAAAVTYRMLLDEANDVPGTYELDFTFTVVAN